MKVQLVQHQLRLLHPGLEVGGDPRALQSAVLLEGGAGTIHKGLSDTEVAPA